MGCLAKVPVSLPKKIKLGARTIDYVFISYVLNSSAYKFLVRKPEIPDIHVNMIIKSRFEDIFPYKREEKKISGKKHIEQHSGTKDPMNQQLKRKLN